MYWGGGNLSCMHWEVEIVVEIDLNVFKCLYQGIELKYSNKIKALITKWLKYGGLWNQRKGSVEDNSS